MLDRIAEVKGKQHHGPELAESDEQKAQRLLARMLPQAGWQGAHLKTLAKGNLEKEKMAVRLRTDTTMTWSWIADHLAMGHWRTAANVVRNLAAHH
jgi:hypothetical protein